MKLNQPMKMEFLFCWKCLHITNLKKKKINYDNNKLPLVMLKWCSNQMLNVKNDGVYGIVYS